MRALIKSVALSLLVLNLDGQVCSVGRMPQTYEFSDTLGCCNNSKILFGAITLNAAETFAYIAGMSSKYAVTGEPDNNY